MISQNVKRLSPYNFLVAGLNFPSQEIFLKFLCWVNIVKNPSLLDCSTFVTFKKRRRWNVKNVDMKLAYHCSATLYNQGSNLLAQRSSVDHKTFSIKFWENSPTYICMSTAKGITNSGDVTSFIPVWMGLNQCLPLKHWQIK